MNEKSQALERVVKGIKTKRITDADFLSLAIESSAKKKAKIDLSNDKENFQSSNINKNLFNRDICQPGGNEEVSSLKPYSASPFKAFGDSYKPNKSNKSQSSKNNIEINRRRPSDFILEAVNDAVEISMKEIQSSFEETNEPSNDNLLTNTMTMLPEVVTENTLNDENIPDSIFISKESISKSMAKYLLNILNTGSYDELISLVGIGKIRAMKIFTWRNAGNHFETFDDLYEIDMNEKNILKFIRANLGSLLTDSM